MRSPSVFNGNFYNSDRETNRSFFNNLRASLEKYRVEIYENGLLIELYKTDYEPAQRILEQNALDLVAILEKKNNGSRYEVRRIS